MDSHNAEQMLLAAGLRPTANRLLVLRAILAHEGTFSLAEMEEMLVSVDKSTIFRTLTLLVEHHLLHEVDNGSGTRRYCLCECNLDHSEHHHTHTSHIHFTCTRCGRTLCIKEVPIPHIDLPDAFEVEEISCHAKGLCPDCR